MIYKIAFTIGIIIAVFKGFKLFETFRQKLADDGEPPEKPTRSRTARARQAEPQPAPKRPKAVDLVACPKCGAYVPNGTICRSVEECVHKG
ncbi:MAG: hypothetical protein R3C97_02180 [Geminicoccaceae bacterium]